MIMKYRIELVNDAGGRGFLSVSHHRKKVRYNRPVILLHTIQELIKGATPLLSGGNHNNTDITNARC